MIENLKKHLPWPLSMVGRLGEEEREERERTERYPDSIQSILRDIQPSQETHYDTHQVLPFLDIDQYDDNYLGYTGSRQSNY